MCEHIIGYVRDEPDAEPDDDDLVILVRIERSLPLPSEYQDIETPFVFCPLCGKKLFTTYSAQQPARSR